MDALLPDITEHLSTDVALACLAVAHQSVARRQHRDAETAPDPGLIDDQAIATLSFINGVMMTFVAGQPIVDSAEHLDRLIQGVIAGVGHARGD